MTTFHESFFEEEEKEICSWSKRGYVEIHKFLGTTEYTLDDLVLVGIVEKRLVLKPPGMSYGLNGDYSPKGHWKNEFHQGEHFNWYITIESMDSIIEILKNNMEVKNQVITRMNEKNSREYYSCNVIDDEEKYSTELENNHDYGSKNDLKNGIVNNYEGERLSETHVVAVTSMAILLCAAYIALPRLLDGRLDPVISFVVFSFLSYSPVRFVIKDGKESIVQNIKEMFFWLLIIFVGFFLLSMCSDGGGDSCYYRVGCL